MKFLLSLLLLAGLFLLFELSSPYSYLTMLFVIWPRSF